MSKGSDELIGYIIFESSTNDGGDGDILGFFLKVVRECVILMVFKLALLKVWELLTDTFSRKTDREEFLDDYIKTQDDVLKIHKATMMVSKTRQPQTIRFSNGEEVTFSHCNVEFDWSRCKT